MQRNIWCSVILCQVLVYAKPLYHSSIKGLGIRLAKSLLYGLAIIFGMLLNETFSARHVLAKLEHQLLKSLYILDYAYIKTRKIALTLAYIINPFTPSTTLLDSWYSPFFRLYVFLPVKPFDSTSLLHCIADARFSQ